jgi:hypothetical protein
MESRILLVVNIGLPAAYLSLPPRIDEKENEAYHVSWLKKEREPDASTLPPLNV